MSLIKLNYYLKSHTLIPLSLSLWFGGYLLEPAALALPDPGPFVAAEQNAPAKLIGKTALNTPAKEALKLRRRRYEANLLAPLPLNFLGGLLTLKTKLRQEERRYDIAAQNPVYERSSLAQVGFIYIPHVAEGTPHAFIQASRSGSMSFKDAYRPMQEFIVGMDIPDTDMPFSLKLTPTDRTETKFFVRWQKYPGFNRWLFAIGHSIRMAMGLTIDMHIPTHLQIGLETPDRRWQIYLAYRWETISYPLARESTRGWLEGETTTALLGIKRHLASIFYTALEAGAQRETSHHFDYKGHKQSMIKTAFAPWARLTVETQLGTP